MNLVFGILVELDIRQKDYFMFERISIKPDICHGEACIKGTRITVHQIVNMLANGDTINDLINDFPSIDEKDILACLEYSAYLAEEQVTPFESLSK